jgi:hypothetical protein
VGISGALAPDGTNQTALAPRLVVNRLLDAQGQAQAEWVLLASLPDTVSAPRIALWYYFRWQIETFFNWNPIPDPCPLIPPHSWDR